MKDKEIIQALECCVGFGDCEEKCPYYAFENCHSELKRDMIHLFEYQKAEMGRLQSEIVDTNKIAKAEGIKELAERFEYFVLHEDPEINELKCKDYESYMGGVNQLRLQIVKGINNLVKEMVGDGK